MTFVELIENTFEQDQKQLFTVWSYMDKNNSGLFTKVLQQYNEILHSCNTIEEQREANDLLKTSIEKLKLKYFSSEEYFFKIIGSIENAKG